MQGEVLAILMVPVVIYLGYLILYQIPKENNAPYRYQLEEEKKRYSDFLSAVALVFPEAKLVNKNTYSDLHLKLYDASGRGVGKIYVKSYLQHIYGKKIGEKDRHHLTVEAVVGNDKIAVNDYVDDDFHKISESLETMKLSIRNSEELQKIILKSRFK
jgi:hypothetical protein